MRRNQLPTSVGKWMMDEKGQIWKTLDEQGTAESTPKGMLNIVITQGQVHQLLSYIVRTSESNCMQDVS